VPAGLARIVAHCLEKEASARFQSAADIGFNLGSMAGAKRTATGSAPQTTPSRLGKWPWIAAALAIVAALSLGAFIYTRHLLVDSPPQVARLLMGLQPADSILGGPGTNSQARPTRTAIAWAPDGRTLVFGGGRAGTEQLYLRRLDQSQATLQTGALRARNLNSEVEVCLSELAPPVQDHSRPS